MDTQFLNEFKSQALIFFKEKVKAARLALTDATPAQLLTEEIMSEDSLVPDTRSMRLISCAAFEVDDYYRIVGILHKKLITFERQHWRPAYKALILLEHLLTHGPVRTAKEFQDDQAIIRKMAKFQHVDEKGFNWGLSVQRKSERVSKLIEDETFLKEERARTRKLTSGIKGFGSFGKLTISKDDTWNQSTSKSTIRCNSQFTGHEGRECADSVLASEFEEEGTRKATVIIDEVRDLKPEKVIVNTPDVYNKEEDHPFCGAQHQDLTSLLS